MPKTETAKSPQLPANEPNADPKVTPDDTQAPLEERSHVFEHRHWVNEACGDDLWDT